MKELIKHQEDNTQTVERFIAMAPGEFWRFTGVVDVSHVEKGHVLLIERIDDIENQPHTLHIRYHPSVIESIGNETFKIRVKDFLDNFEFVEKKVAEASRHKNIEGIQSRIKGAQDELIAMTTDIQYLDNKITQAEFDGRVDNGVVQLPQVIEQIDADIVSAINTQKISSLMSPGLTATGIDQIKAGMTYQRDITVKRADFIQNQTKTLSQIATEMTPYFKEQAATALAVTSDMRDHVDSLMKGIDTLNLYVLKNVEVEVIKEGKSADSSIPLTIAQSILYMDEEAVVHFDVSEDFDFRNRISFFKSLANSPELLRQIFPTERSVVGMATTRMDKKYESKGVSSIEANQLTLENQTMYLVVRDGERLTVVLSPEFWHQQTTRLFPSQDDVESKFRGIDGSQITYDDLNYTASVKSHELLALKYKRLLVLLCGLDHNKQVFGDFYAGEPSLDFISLEFQEKYFRFIHDGDGEGLIATSRPQNIKDWLKELNSEVTSGSRLLLIPHKAIDEDTLPSAYEKESIWHIVNRTNPSMRYSMGTNEHGYHVGIVRTEKGRLVMDVSLSGYNAKNDEREFNSKFYVDKMLKSEWEGSFVNLDRLDPVDVDWYIKDRRTRAIDVETIKLLKCAALYNQEMFEDEKPVRNALLKALYDGDVAGGDEARVLVSKALAKWKCANPRKDVNGVVSSPSAFNGLCDQMFALTGKVKDVTPDVKAAERSAGRRLVRFSLLTDGQYCAYSECNPSDIDDDLAPFVWVSRTRYTLKKCGLKGSKTTLVLMKKVANEEAVLFESDDVAEFVAPQNPPFRTIKTKRDMLDKVESPNFIVSRIMGAKDDNERYEAFIRLYLAKRSSLSVTGVKEPCAYIVFGVRLRVVYDEEHFVNQFGMACESFKLIVWLAKDDTDRLAKLKSAFISIYQNKIDALKKFSDTLNDVSNIDNIWGVFQFSMFEARSSSIFSEDMHASPVERSLFCSYSHDDSLQRALAKNKRNDDRHNGIWLHPELMGNIDAFCAVKRPEGFEPHIIVKGSFVSGDPIVSLFRVVDVTNDEMALFRRLSNVVISPFDTLGQALELVNRERRYTYNSTPVLSIPREIEPQTFKGVKAIKSWEHFDEDLIVRDE
tara:strand:- start:16103 stop:19441 length:3339 start_codon:yes stop_codon:yes gene_type:complete